MLIRMAEVGWRRADESRRPMSSEDGHGLRVCFASHCVRVYWDLSSVVHRGGLRYVELILLWKRPRFWWMARHFMRKLIIHSAA